MPSFHAADGAEIFYDERGPGGTIPILFVHGWQGDARVWGPVADVVSREFHTIAVDLRGHGRSAGAPGPYRVENLADDLSAMVAALDLDPLVAVGHSMGAAVVQRFAIDRPDAVEALVLVAPVPVGAKPLHPKADALFRGTIGNPQNAAAWLARLTVTPPSDATVKLMRAVAAAAPPEVTLENYESWTTLAFADEAATIATPTLVLAPDHDRPDFVREHVAAVVSGSRFETIADAGHYVILERPAEVAAAVEKFVGEL